MKEEVRKNYERMLGLCFEEKDGNYDADCGLIGFDVEEKNVIHSNVVGRAHSISCNAVYVQLVYMCKKEERYARAESIIRRIIAAQDKNIESSTYGLWSSYFEEGLDKMTDPDYNMAEFVARPLIYVMLERRECISDELCGEIKGTLRRAAQCCIRRNVGLDYSNVAAMSCVTISTIGELLGDDELIKAGERELAAFTEYTRFCGGFNEYNSPCYFKVVGDAIARMRKYLKGEKQKACADELNEYLWRMVSTHYSSGFCEFAPPLVRAYGDTDYKDENMNYIYFATDGNYGRYTDAVNDWEFNIAECPPKYYKNFDSELWLEDTYYKKNNLRERDTDATIVRDFDSPDLVAYTYKKKDYMFGALQKTDLWDQRRTSMLMWDRDLKRTIKLRCEMDGFSFCSAMAYTAQHKDDMLTVVGFSVDHGNKHYILDMFEDGKIKAKKLAFSMKLNESCGGQRLERRGDELIYSDGEISFSIKIAAWVFDGKPGEIRYADDGFELICCDGEEREIDLGALRDTYGIISMSVNKAANDAGFTVRDGRLSVSSADGRLSIDTYSIPEKYNECIRHTTVTTDYREE